MHKEDIYGEDRELFKKAIGEAFIRKFDHELLKNIETAQCSEQHTQKMTAIIEKGRKRTGKKKWIITLLVAAAIFLTGCTVYVFREDIRDFVEEVFDKHIKVTYNDQDAPVAPAEITENYTLTVLPEGYVLVDEFFSPFVNTCKWKNDENISITFEQCVLDNANFALDAEQGETMTINIGQYTVYYRFNAEMQEHYYIWNDGKYAFKIFSSQKFEKNTLNQLIRGVEIKQ